MILNISGANGVVSLFVILSKFDAIDRTIADKRGFFVRTEKSELQILCYCIKLVCNREIEPSLRNGSF